MLLHFVQIHGRHGDEMERGRCVETDSSKQVDLYRNEDIVETTLALDNYRRACDSGRGAVFFSVARGKVAGV